MSRIVAQTSYWQKDHKNFDGYQSYLPTLMDFSLNDNVVSSLNTTKQIAHNYLLLYLQKQHDRTTEVLLQGGVSTANRTS